MRRLCILLISSSMIHALLASICTCSQRVYSAAYSNLQISVRNFETDILRGYDRIFMHSTVSIRSDQNITFRTIIVKFQDVSLHRFCLVASMRFAHAFLGFRDFCVVRDHSERVALSCFNVIVVLRNHSTF